MKPIIKVKNLYKSFNKKDVLQNINLEVFPNESIVIFGQSGSGKSVLFKTILGMIAPSSGQIYIGGKLAQYYLKEKDRFKINKDISMVFQGSALFDSYTIATNITFGISAHQKLTKKKLMNIAIDKLEKVGLDSSIATLYPSEISGGMQKRVAIARAIATNPKIIFFDEPTSGLDPISANLITDLIKHINTTLKVTCLTISHDISGALNMASKIYLLYDKQISWQGSSEDFISSSNPIVKQFNNGIVF